jgi:mRNA-degrading endonuclease RelE of RelBE toxin-antitoxin system
MTAKVGRISRKKVRINESGMEEKEDSIETTSPLTPVGVDEKYKECMRVVEYYNNRLFTDVQHAYNRNKKWRHRIGDFKLIATVEDHAGTPMLYAMLCTAEKRMAQGKCLLNERDTKELLRGMLIQMCTKGIKQMFKEAVILEEDAI